MEMIRLQCSAVRAAGALILLVGALSLTGCGESGKERAMRSDGPVVTEQHRARFIAGQTDR